MTVQVTTRQDAAPTQVTAAAAIISRFALEQDVRESSRRAYASVMSSFFGWVEASGRTISALSVSDIIAYKENLLATKSPLTVAAHINGIRRFYTWAEANRYFPNIAKAVHAPKRKNDEFRHKPLSVSKVGELLSYEKATLSARDYALVNLMVRTGLRCVEVVRANIEDITYIGENNTRVLLVQGKGCDSRDNWVVLTDAAYYPIAEYLETRKGAKVSEPLFASEANHTAKAENHRNSDGTTQPGFHPLRLSTRAVSGICKKGLRAIGLDSRLFSAHSLRHTAGTNILRAGGTLEQAQQTLRHSNPATTQIYVKMALKERRLSQGGEMLLDNLYNSAFSA